MTFAEMKLLAWTMVVRSDATESLYRLEEQVSNTVSQAGDEIQRLASSPDGNFLISRDEAITLELVATLERFRPASILAARIFVDRYGMNERE